MNTVVDKIRRLLLNYDLTVAYAFGEIEVRKSIMDLYRGDTRKPSQRKFIQAKVDKERFEIYVEEVAKAKKELKDNVLYVLNRYNPKYKDIFWMACIEQKTYEEISQITGYSYDAIYKIVHKVKNDIISKFTVDNETIKRKRKKKPKI